MVYQKRKVILLCSVARDTFCPVAFGQRWVEALRWGWGGVLCNSDAGAVENRKGKGLSLNLFLPWSLEEGANPFKVTWKRERAQQRAEPAPAGPSLRMQT